jgi:hypothetical protein
VKGVGALVLLLAAVLVVPMAAVTITRRHELPPAALRTPISEFGAHLAHQLDRSFARAWFVTAELRASDDLTILIFELDVASPWLKPERAFLASRCVPLEELVPLGMSGGIISGDIATDPEITYLKSDAQPPCPRSAP